MWQCTPRCGNVHHGVAMYATVLKPLLKCGHLAKWDASAGPIRVARLERVHCKGIFIPMKSLIDRYNLAHMIFTFLHYRDNPGGGMLLRQVKGIFILNSIFKDNRDYSLYNENRDLSADLRRGSGLTIFYLNDTELGQTLVTNCTFENNSATLNESNQEDALDRPRLYVPRGHGGGLLLAFQNASGHRVDIRDCLFKNNTAKFTGGAISIQFYRGLSNAQVVQPSSHDNVVMIENSSFWNNTSLEKGGGVSINAFETANENTVVVNGSLFDGNFAGQNGGALSSIIEVSVFHTSQAHVRAKQDVYMCTSLLMWFLKNKIQLVFLRLRDTVCSLIIHKLS